MSGPLLLAAVCAAGGAGAVARYHVDRSGAALLRRGLPATRVPWGTLAVNVSGSLLLGVLTAAAAVPGSLLVVAGTGLCGGYTTFSTAVVEVLRLRQAGSGRAVAYAVGTLLATVAAAVVGTAVGAAVGVNLRGGPAG